MKEFLLRINPMRDYRQRISSYRILSLNSLDEHQRSVHLHVHYVRNNLKESNRNNEIIRIDYVDFLRNCLNLLLTN